MKDLAHEVDLAMRRICAGSASPTNPVILAVNYHLSVPGNQLRARLCLDACDRLGISPAISVGFAATCELLHNASLLHDDLMDRSPRRRGRRSTWSQFSDGIAICAGDLMLSAAFSSMQTTPASCARELGALVSSRTQELICGQAQELQATLRPQSSAGYEALAVGKSASLISLCLQLPLLFAGLGAALPLAQQVADAFAVAYQIADDLRDVEEDQLANCLNFVQVLATSLKVSVAEARGIARERAEDQMITVLALADRLPSRCGSVLTDHVLSLQAQLGVDLPTAGVQA